MPRYEKFDKAHDRRHAFTVMSQSLQLAMSYPGVTKTYAIQAGRELRVIVGADKIDDKQTELLSGEIAKKIQDEMTYPGQVKITVIRETRAVNYAR